MNILFHIFLIEICTNYVMYTKYQTFNLRSAKCFFLTTVIYIFNSQNVLLLGITVLDIYMHFFTKKIEDKMRTNNAAHEAFECATFHYTFYSLLFDGLYFYRSQQCGNYNIFPEASLISNKKHSNLVQLRIIKKHFFTFTSAWL